jgi:hypothetical protein
MLPMRMVVNSHAPHLCWLLVAMMIMIMFWITVGGEEEGW